MCHTYCDTEHPFILVISEDPCTHTYCRAFSNGAITTCFLRLFYGLWRLGFAHLTFRLWGERSNPLRHLRGACRKGQLDGAASRIRPHKSKPKSHSRYGMLNISPCSKGVRSKVLNFGAIHEQCKWNIFVWDMKQYTVHQFKLWAMRGQEYLLIAIVGFAILRARY